MQEDPMRPDITLGIEEHRRLLTLAMTERGHTVQESDYLHYELGRAHIVPDNELSGDIARIGSTVTYRFDGEKSRTATLVVPADADASLRNMSVISILGAALLGLRPRQAITLMGWDGSFRKLSVLSVLPPPRDRAPR